MEDTAASLGICKSIYNGKYRICTLLSKYQELKEKLCYDWNLENPDNIKILYIDDEDDQVEIKTDTEYNYAKTTFLENNKFKVMVEVIQDLKIPQLAPITRPSNDYPVPKHLRKNIKQTKVRTGKKGMGVFVGHIKTKDNSIIQPGAKFLKVWRLENQGIIKWPVGSKLTIIGDYCDRMGAPESIPIPEEDLPEPGYFVDIAYHFTAPTQPGFYMGYWRMTDPDGVRFGERIRVKIQVV